MEAVGKIYIGHNSVTDWIKLWGLADFHYGNKACALKVLKKDIGFIADDPFSFAVGVGDYAEFIDFHDPRFDHSCVPKDLTIEDYGDLGIVLVKRIKELLNPIKHKLVAMTIGNHEKQYMKRSKQNSLMSTLASDLGTKYLGYSAFFDIVFVRDAKFTTPRIINSDEIDNNTSQRNSFRVFAHHGFGNALTEGGKLNTLIKIMDRFIADIYLTAHVHDQSAKAIVQLGANDSCTKLINNYKVGLITGSYLKTYEQGVTNYGEEKGFKPVALSARFVKICPYTREIRAEI